MKAFWGIAAVTSGLLAVAPASAQGTYPDRTVRILVGFPAGGPPDIAARLLAERLTARKD
jgi:tripartite-type tricarboxylate transporter receptor subunit TctC